MNDEMARLGGRGEAGGRERQRAEVAESTGGGLAAPTPAEDRPNGPRSRKGVQTRARLLAAAKEVFEESGFLDARVSDIAERAGLSHGSFYHYFESKEEVFREVAASVDDLLAAPQRTIVLDPSSRALPSDRIREAMRRYLENYREEAKIVGVIEQVSRYDAEVGGLRLARHQGYVQAMAASIRQLQQRGLADPAIDPQIVAAALGALTVRFAESWLVEGAIDCDFDDAVDQMTLVFVNTLGLRDEPGQLDAATSAN